MPDYLIHLRTKEGKVEMRTEAGPHPVGAGLRHVELHGDLKLTDIISIVPLNPINDSAPEETDKKS
jgi:hypothetical protein